MKDFEGFYKTQLIYYLSDENISQDEEAELLHLKSISNLSDLITNNVHKEVGESTYTENVRNLISDGKIEPAEKTSLRNLQEVLKLPDEEASRIYIGEAKIFLNNLLNSTISNQRYSIDDEKNLTSVANNLGIKLSYDEKTTQLLARYRLYWLIEDGEILTIEPDINLTRGEKCYFSCNSNHYEINQVTKRIKYSGPTYRLKIVKGLYWRMGDLGVKRETSDVLCHIDSGRLFLTNKRVIFMGGKKDTTIRLSNILDFKLFKDGVELQKSSGKNPFFEFDKNVDIFAMTLGRALKDSG